MAEPDDNLPEGPVQGEVVDERPLPVPREPDGSTELATPRPLSLPATVAAATGGFVLGVAAFTLLRILRRPAAARRLARKRRKVLARRGVDIESSRSFLVDVHLLKR